MGLKFHRVEPGFVVQGGEPEGRRNRRPGLQSQSRVQRKSRTCAGRSQWRASSQPDSAGSQFYICLDDAPFLDRQYTVFGQMTEGFEALDAIRRGDVMTKVTVEPESDSLETGACAAHTPQSFSRRTLRAR